MSEIGRTLAEHHQYCDTLFARAEDAVRGRDWTRAREGSAAFALALFSHLAAEEDILFPAFEAATGMLGGPTQVMRQEHGQMRELAREMEAAAAAGAEEDFLGAAETLLILMQQHNMKEENMLYPMCDRSLAGGAGAGLVPAIAARLEEGRA